MSYGGSCLDSKKLIRDFIVENALLGSADAELRDDDSFLEKGIIDSTGVLELVSFVEEEFAIEVKDEELIPENFDSISTLSEYITRKKIS
jgi:acyl carrier protein